MLILPGLAAKSTKSMEPAGPLFAVFADFAARKGGAE